MRTPRVIEVNHVEFRRDRVAVQVRAQVVIGDYAQVVELEVIDIQSEALFDLLLDEVVDHRIRLARAGRSHYGRGTERVDHVDSPVVPAFLIVVAHGDIDRVRVGNQAGLLLEALVFMIERVIHHALRHQASEPHATRQQQDVACDQGSNIETACRRQPGRQMQQGVRAQEQHTPGREAAYDHAPGDLPAAHAARTQA